MNSIIPKTRFLFLVIAFCLIGNQAMSQDSLKVFLDTSSNLSANLFSISWTSGEYSYQHSPNKEYSRFYKKHKNLIAAEPSDENYRNYYSLACSLWELSLLRESENMFLKIVNSTQPFYTGTYNHPSDIPGDPGENIYGYGSYTSNYKNYSCRYLTKIYLEEKKYDQALLFIKLADQKYPVEYNCGTGHLLYHNEINGLYDLCYDGLGMYDTIIEHNLNNYYDYYNGLLVKALRKKYSAKEILDYLTKAEESVACIVDTFSSSRFTTYNYGTKDEKTVESRYISGTATMNLFGKVVVMAIPRLENGEVANKERFIKEFKESGFYITLTNYP